MLDLEDIGIVSVVEELRKSKISVDICDLW